MKNEYTHCLIRTLSLDRAYDPAMGNLIMRFARPGTQRIKVEAPPVVRRDVVFTHSVDAKDRSSQTNTKHQNSVATEGLNRYNGAQRGAKACKAMAKAEEAATAEVENEDVQQFDARDETKADTRPKQLFASPEFFGEAAPPDSAYGIAVQMKTNSRPTGLDETISKTETSGSLDERAPSKESPRERTVTNQRN